MVAFSSARFLANFFARALRLRSRMIMLVLAICSLALLLLAEGEAERVQQGAAFLVVLRGGGDGDVHAPDLVDLVVVDLGEDDLFGDAEVVVALAVEAAGLEAAEVADARQRDADQALQELVHALAAQRHLDADREVLANLEAGD